MPHIKRSLIFAGTDHQRNRWAVEQEKMRKEFPQFKFYATGNRITSVKGYLYSGDVKRYFIIEIPPGYPNKIPKVWPDGWSPSRGLHHVFRDGSLCVMTPNEWTRNFSLAFLVGQIALWNNKYQYYLKYGYWPERRR
ncbi:MAG: hypothetical protein ACTSQE_13455 [Candidatus Heimdallarchaeaceae archaeon]